MLIRDAEIAGCRADLKITGDRIAAIAPRLSAESGERVFDAGGRALIPGLHDHHLHLLSLAAALSSRACGPPAVRSRNELAAALAARPSDSTGWLRGAGYFESVAGPLDRSLLDALCPSSPLRIQHRSGSMWFLNSLAIEALGLDDLDPSDLPEGVERDAAGRVTGRLFRLDGWLRSRLPAAGAPDLAPVGRLLARCGVTGVTDATPSNGAEEVALFRRARRDGALPQKLRLMGTLALAASAHGGDDAEADAGGIAIDAHKILLDEPALPELEGVVHSIREAHASARPVAIHSVTRTEIHFALAALESAGVRSGDRLEHASVAPPEVVERVSELGLTVVTQPGFVSERGDDYLEAVAARDQPHLYRVAGWIDSGVQLGGGSDAPFGQPDPWAAMRAAVERRTDRGAVLGADERVSPEQALALFGPALGRIGGAPAGPPNAPGVAVGGRADLCLLDAPWRIVRRELSSDRVRATFCDGEPIYVAAA